MKHKQYSIITTITFAGLLTCASFFGLFHTEKGFSENENRYLAKFQKPIWNTILNGKFQESYEEFLADQILFRDQWIALKTRLEKLQNKKEINGVFFARDGYYIERHAKEEFVSEQAEKNSSYLIKFLEKYNAELGAEHVQVLLVPTASCILSEKLPLLAPSDGQKEFLERLRTRINEKNWVSVYDTLREHAEEEIFYRTDHHWTSLGAYYAYREWASKRSISYWERQEFSEVILTNEFLGTIHSKINISVKPDVIIAMKPNRSIEYAYCTNMEEEWKEGLYDNSKLLTKDKYSVFLGGNNPLIEIRGGPPNGKRLLMLKDSFAHCAAQFYINHFEQIYLIDFRYYNGSIEKFIRDYKITDLFVLYNTSNFVSDRYLGGLLK